MQTLSSVHDTASASNIRHYSALLYHPSKITIIIVTLIEAFLNAEKRLSTTFSPDITYSYMYIFRLLHPILFIGAEQSRGGSETCV